MRPQHVSFPLLSTVMMAGRFPPFFLLPARPGVVWSSSTAVVHRMTLRVLHTDCHEVFSADHRQTFWGPQRASGIASTRPPLFQHNRPVPAGHLDRHSGWVSPWRRVNHPITGTLHGGRCQSLPHRSPRSDAAAKSPSRENTGRVFLAEHWRTILVLSAGPSPMLPALPARATPITAAVPCSKGLGKGSHRPENVAFAVRGPRFFAVVSWSCRHGSLLLRDKSSLFGKKSFPPPMVRSFPKSGRCEKEHETKQRPVKTQLRLGETDRFDDESNGSTSNRRMTKRSQVRLWR